MRYGFLASAIAICIGVHQGWLARAYDHVTSAALSDDAHSAIDLRCDGREGRAAEQCRKLLEKLYLAKTLDPEKTLRAHCTPMNTVEWGARAPAPPALCIEHYGGWQRG